MDKGQATLKGIEEFAPECAILKVYGSDTLITFVDEGSNSREEWDIRLRL